jgi:protein TonB
MLALVFEALLLIGGAFVLNRPLPPAPARDEIRLDLTTLPPPDLPKPPEPAPEPRKVDPVRAVPQKSLAKPAPHRPAPQPIPMRSQPTPVGPVSNAPSDFASPPPAPPTPPAPPAPSVVSDDVLDLFQAQARAAVQAALRYPNAAKVLKLTGQCRVGFDYRDGRAFNAHIVTSSGHEVLDDAALAALNSAVLPAASPELAGRILKLTIAVVFSAQS